MQRKRLSAVQNSDVKTVGETIKFKLISKQISLDQIDQYLFPTEIQEKGEITVKEMQDVLRRDPFLIENPLDVINTARYLIEDNNTLDFVDYKEDQSEKCSIVRSIFKKLVQNYSFFENEKEMHDKIANVMISNQWQSGILDQLNKLRGHKKSSKESGTLECTKYEFCDSFAYLDSSMLKNKEIDYMYYQLYKSSGDLNKIDLLKFFGYFSSTEGGESEEKGSN